MTHHRHIRALSTAAILCASTLASAQFDGSLMAGYGNAMATVGLNAMNTQMLLGSMPGESVSATAAAPRGQAASTRVIIQPAATERSLAKLAAVYPQAQRAQVLTTLRQLLEGFHGIEQQFDIPRNDLAAAVAGFIAGSYMAYQDVAFPDASFKPLVQQIRQVVGTNPEFTKASPAQKQEMYEQMAALGMFMATSQMALKERPDAQLAASMKQAARAYLEQFLKTDADRVQITSQGLAIR